MSFLLDTNVISELRRRTADPSVVAWAESHDRHSVYLSAVTIMEIELGIARMERRDPRQGAALRIWMTQQVLTGFADRILPVDTSVSLRAAHLHVPNPRPERDAFIAATAAEHTMTVVTRNVADFHDCGVAIVDPWRFDSNP
ncbi:MAG TPA: type II toxin-antitoxin system VapC family toxin [Arachnia sp.]|nr:type II toxin-antitoxin system VapC family toxin [Propionibacteriaceae bacterium]HOA26583.1 type II toxin-antitoxin system VapC family toxin [Arachnia sp.]HQD20958.1 type II toxin-antitoxin system VapC family toxin [Arachnia sp.]